MLPLVCRAGISVCLLAGMPLVASAAPGSGFELAAISGPAPAGLYLGVEGFRVDGGGVPATINGPNPAGVTVASGEDDRTGWATTFGYQWADGLALEGHLLDLGDAPVALESNGASLDELDNAAGNLHPQTARGVQLGVRQAWYFTSDWQASIGGGLWYWRSEWNAVVDGASRTYDDSGMNPAANLETGWQVGDQVEVRMRLRHLRLDSGYVNTLGLGLVYQWSRRDELQ